MKQSDSQEREFGGDMGYDYFNSSNINATIELEKKIAS
jgi:hypothetical protein